MNISSKHGVQLQLAIGGKTGAILGMVLVMVVALSMVGIGLLSLGRGNALEVSRAFNLNRAFWAAESGLYQARAVLLKDMDFRNRLFPRTLVNNLGARSVVISTNYMVFTITSTGTVRDAVRIVRQTVVIDIPGGLPNAFDYALFGGTNDLYIKKNSNIDGDVFVYGNITYKYPLTLTNGTIYEAVTGEVNVVVGSELPPSPLPVPPIIMSNQFQSLINDLNLPITPMTNPIPLYGGVWRYSGATLNVGAVGVVGSSAGTDTLVVDGDVTISNGGMLTNVLRIIAGGNVYIDGNLGFTSTNFIYSAKDVEFRQNATVNNTTILAMGNITAKKDLTYTGLLFANGGVDFQKQSVVTGSVVAVNGFALQNSMVDKNYNVTWNTNVFQFMGVITNAFEPESVSLSPRPDWQEVFPE